MNALSSQVRSVSVDLNNDASLLIDIPDALCERDKVKFTVHTKVKGGSLVLSDSLPPVLHLPIGGGPCAYTSVFDFMTLTVKDKKMPALHVMNLYPPPEKICLFRQIISNHRACSHAYQDFNLNVNIVLVFFKLKKKKNTGYLWSTGLYLLFHNSQAWFRLWKHERMKIYNHILAL